MATPITTLFLDIGGVLLTNGWGRSVRKQAAEQFKISYDEMDERHHLSFNTYEDGKLNLDQYLDQVIFYEPRSFTREDFKAFMFAASKPFPEMISFITELKTKYRLRIVVVSNEGRELTNYRVKKFALANFVDAFVCSSFVHYRKPDHDIYTMALDISQTEVDEVIYIDDRILFIEVASKIGIRSIRHVGLPTTQAELARYGLSL